MVEYPPAVVKPINLDVNVKLVSEYGTVPSILRNVYIPLLVARSYGIPVLSDEEIFDVLEMIDDYVESISVK